MKFFGKINWPWVRNRKLIEESRNSLREDINLIKEQLIRKRVANFIMVVSYRKGMKLQYDLLEPISLEGLQKRIEALEKKTEGC